MKKYGKIKEEDHKQQHAKERDKPQQPKIKKAKEEEQSNTLDSYFSAKKKE